MHITKKGMELADKLMKFFSADDVLERGPEIHHICSRIGRLATTYTHIQERWCSEEMSERVTKLLENRENTLEATIKRIASELPPTKNGPITVKFEGDPRGYCVKLVVPNAPREGNTWGLGGEFGI